LQQTVSITSPPNPKPTKTYKKWTRFGPGIGSLHASLIKHVKYARTMQKGQTMKIWGIFALAYNGIYDEAKEGI
jgi:hypothetical protein